MTVIPFEPERHNQSGYFSLADLPQRGDVSQVALSCGWPEMDSLWKIYPGQLTVATGLPNHGKSTFLLNVIINMARQHRMKTFMYVPENEGYLRAKMKRIWGERPGFDKFSRDYCFVQSSLPDYYGSEPRPIEWVIEQADQAVQNDGVDFVLIDPWNEIEQARPKDMLESRYVGQCLMRLKQFCRWRDVAVGIVVHPTKAGADPSRLPTLADCEGSMQWYNKCDNGLIVHRHPTSPTSCLVISAKVREYGAGRRGAECHFTVDPDSELFTAQCEAVVPA